MLSFLSSLFIVRSLFQLLINLGSVTSRVLDGHLSRGAIFWMVLVFNMPHGVPWTDLIGSAQAASRARQQLPLEHSRLLLVRSTMPGTQNVEDRDEACRNPVATPCRSIPRHNLRHRFVIRIRSAKGKAVGANCTPHRSTARFGR